MSSRTGSVAEGQQRWDTRWSRVSDSIQRSLSRDRDTRDDERTGRYECDENGKRRSRPPISLGMKKYNKLVAGGQSGL